MGYLGELLFSKNALLAGSGSACALLEFGERLQSTGGTVILTICPSPTGGGPNPTFET
jgi:hypothetical protein